MELSLVLRERTATAAHPFPGRRGFDVKKNRDGALSERNPIRLEHDRPAAERDHRRFAGERTPKNVRLGDTEEILALREELLDRRAGVPLDLCVGVEERPAEPLCHVGADGRLPSAHETDEGDVPV
jgi:hypothetical protein